MREFLAFALIVVLVISTLGAYLFTIEKGYTRNEYNPQFTAQHRRLQADATSGQDVLGDGIRPWSYSESPRP